MAEITIQKLADSCVLVDTGAHRALIDPGFYTWEHDGLDLSSLPALDRLLITHNHQDHCKPEFVEALAAAYPEMVIETNTEVAADLAEVGVSATTAPSEWTEQITAPHEPTPMGSQPLNVGFTVGGLFTHPGDSYTFDATAPVLALPLLPPWGSTTEAVAVARRLAPSHVIIHDWHLTTAGKRWLYGSAVRGLGDAGISVLPLEDFEAVTLEIG